MTPAELNQCCIDRLSAAGLETRVAVIGSGLSNPYIVPLAKLQKKLGKSCRVTARPGTEFWDFAEEAFRNDPRKYFRILRKTFDDTPHWTAKAYRYLVSIPFRGFATLNYDDQLPSEFRARNGDRGFSVYPSKDGQVLANPVEFLSPTKRLVALHGYCDPSNPEWEKQLILKRSDYNLHYFQNPSYTLLQWWGTLLLSIPCVFIGTSLREPGLHRVMDHFREDYRTRLVSMNHLHLVGVRRDRKKRTYEPPGKPFEVIDQIQFDPIDRKFTGLLSILAALSDLQLDRPSPKAAAPKPISVTDKFDFK